MRQREKIKKHREEQKRAKQEKFIAFEEKKLSRREWLMAQPEVSKGIQSVQTSGDIKRNKASTSCSP